MHFLAHIALPWYNEKKPNSERIALSAAHACSAKNVFPGPARPLSRPGTHEEAGVRKGRPPFPKDGFPRTAQR